jgi:NAD(P)-dependent dehydrogenase (short-subunit alcohol dehydrogenase family)
MTNVAVVTGSNQGLGFALVEGLCRALGPAGAVYLTARDKARGEEAARALEQKGLSPVFHLLDVTRDESVAALSERIKAEHGGVDIVISNAAARISRDIPPRDQVAGWQNACILTGPEEGKRAMITYAQALEDHYSRNWAPPSDRVRWNKGPINELPDDFRVLVIQRSPEMMAYATRCMSQVEERRALSFI